jgi:hypothetical protein
MMLTQQMALYSQRAILHGMALGGAQSGTDTVNILRTVNSESVSMINPGASSSSESAPAMLHDQDQQFQ